MGRIVFLIFLSVPLIEIALFIVLGQSIGLWPTLGGVLVTALIGSFLVRRQGLAVLAEIAGQTQRGALPVGQMADGVMIAIAGALLLTPGYFTDLCGFALLVPAVRRFVRQTLGKHFSSVVSVHSAGSDPQNRDDAQKRDSPTIELDEDNWRQR